MAFYITFFLIGCLLILVAVKGTAYQNKYFSIPAITLKSRVYSFIFGILCITLAGLTLYYNNSEDATEKQPLESKDRPSKLTSSQQTGNSVHHVMKLYCCNTDTGAKVCPIDVAVGTPGLPCYCVGSEGAGIICQ